ncbi:uncharacterized protein BYT42DRAFT_559739 [Radiomyces spectabilis]|uniref:uncharacterized protein n=1 Tax=Radiomyces spectabilis TaxID=64574 RepID=UPI00221F9DC4|nr:uncharacterized protein BYT42DRAFT_559739 [Radiomyces spectabilis]KAI8388334.1 hypothetical protein BYT42DRAFT_559739 [Radiomyces spectabilis]
MNSHQCSVVVVGEYPKSTIDLLDTFYGNVVAVNTTNEAFEALQSQPRQQFSSTICLLDIEDDTADERFEFLSSLVRQLESSDMADVVPIVSSSTDKPEFMLKCLDYGAADFLIKPLREDIVKTMFLNVHRYNLRKDQSDRDADSPIKKASNAIKESGGKMWAHFSKRIKEVFVTDNWVAQNLVTYYMPECSGRRSSVFSMTSDRKLYLKAQICSWDFLALNLEEADLIQCVYMIFDQVLDFPELHHLRVPSEQLYDFVFDIAGYYHTENPYHNFRHAVDVLQAIYYFMCKIGLLEPMDPNSNAAFSTVRGSVGFNKWRKSASSNSKSIKRLMKPLDILALVMASIGHDVGHPGVNNMFMVNTSTQLAILYNDRSVLESFHSMTFFHLLQNQCFKQLTDIRANNEYASFRKIVVNSILATDMSMHDDYVRKIEDQAKRNSDHGINDADPSACEQEKILLCGALIKCADISNCARPFPSAKRWAQVLASEFFEQGDLEKELGLPVMPMNERGKVSLEDFQLSFMRNVALKLFKVIRDLCPEMGFCLEYINENIDYWEDIKQHHHDSGVGNDIQSECSHGESPTSKTSSQG